LCSKIQKEKEEGGGLPNLGKRQEEIQDLRSEENQQCLAVEKPRKRKENISNKEI